MNDRTHELGLTKIRAAYAAERRPKMETSIKSFPKTVTFSGKELVKLKERTPSDAPELSALKTKAERLLQKETLSVVYRNQKAPSGNPHDYTSMGPYWWPDPTKPDGLPYVRRDGEVNPETKEKINFSSMANAVFTLSLAAFWLEDDRFSSKAVKMIRDWYIEEETYMNPSLEYGQSIPGICTGRGIGLIDFSNSYCIFDACRILEYIGKIDDDTVCGLKKWYTEFVNWMLTSEIGVDEDDQHNNHGTWFDVQVASAAIFTDRPVLARKTLKTAYDRRIKKHICPDGSQPHELARTRAMHYSCYNLNAMLLLARMARISGVKAAYFEENDGEKCLLRRAVDYLYSFFQAPDTFPYQEISEKFPNSTMCASMLTIAQVFGEPEYAEKAEKYLEKDMLLTLFPQA